MTPILFIKNLLTKIKASADKDPGKITIHSDRVWFFILAVFFVINTMVVFFSFYFFKGINSNNIFPTTGSGGETLNTISREKLNQALDYLHAKDANFEYIKNHKPNIIDPSR